MDRIINKKLDYNSIILILSRFFERIGFYGFKAIFFVYVIKHLIVESDGKALELIGYFSLGIGITYLIGGLLGDLVIGHKRSILFGGLLQTIGICCFLIPNDTLFYFGLFSVIIGSGFYAPNILANFSKLYFNKIDLLKSDLALYYLFVNFGAFIGTLFIGLIYEHHGFFISLLIIASCMLIGALLPLLMKSVKQFSNETSYPKHSHSFLKISSAILLSAVFWFLYEKIQIYSFDLEMDFVRGMKTSDSNFVFGTLNTYLLAGFVLILIIITRFVYIRSSLLLALSFFSLVSGFSAILFIPNMGNSEQFNLFAIFVAFVALAETFLLTVVQFAVTKYSNLKYLATVTALSLLIPSLLGILFNYLIYYRTPDSYLIQPWIIISLSLISGISVFVYFLKTRQKSTIE